MELVEHFKLDLQAHKFGDHDACVHCGILREEVEESTGLCVHHREKANTNVVMNTSEIFNGGKIW